MNLALIFARDRGRLFDPYRSRSFLEGLRRENFEPMIGDLVLGEDSSLLDLWPNAAEEVLPDHADRRSLSDVLRSHQPLIVHTFGDIMRLGSVWTRAAQAGCPVVHFVTSGCDRIGTRASNIRRTAWSRDGLRARHASRHVGGIVGSSRASIANHIESSFFPHAKFSMIALPPTPIAGGIEDRTQIDVSAMPTLGHYDHAGVDEPLNFLFDATNLTGSQQLFRLLIARGDGSPVAGVRAPANVSFRRVAEVSDFVQSIDVLIVPQSDDRAMEGVLLALRSKKIVIAPDGGTISEALQFGRHGVLFRAGSACHLAMAINEVTESWKRPPFGFEGVDAVFELTSPDEVARIFARAYRKLEDLTTPELKNMMAR
jgi:hypothetical protein